MWITVINIIIISIPLLREKFELFDNNMYYHPLDIPDCLHLGNGSVGMDTQYSRSFLLSLNRGHQNVSKRLHHTVRSLGILNRKYKTNRGYRHRLNRIYHHRRSKYLTRVPRINKIRPNTNSLKLCIINTRSIRNKTTAVLDFVIGNNIDLCLCTETWLKQNDVSIRASLRVNGYQFDDVIRNGNGGGVGLLCKSGANIKLINSGLLQSYEYGDWLVTSNNNILRLIIVYRPPSTSLFSAPVSVFVDQFGEHLEQLSTSKEKILICGGFNIHVEDKNLSDTKKFVDLLDSFNIRQHVYVPTHESGHTLDLILTRDVAELQVSDISADAYISDHSTVTFLLDQKPMRYAENIVKYRRIKDININYFCNDLAKHHDNIMSCTDVNQTTQLIEDIFAKTLDKHAPEYTKKYTDRPKMPWFPEDLMKIKICRRKHERDWRRKRTNSSKERFHLARNKFNRELQKARNNIIMTKLQKLEKIKVSCFVSFRNYQKAKHPCLYLNIPMVKN